MGRKEKVTVNKYILSQYVVRKIKQSARARVSCSKGAVPHLGSLLYTGG
jgi:hypothetical protein